MAGMQYLNTAHGRKEREQVTGQPEPVEKIRMKPWDGSITFSVKEKCCVKAGEEMRVAYGWTSAAWARVLGGEEAGCSDEVVRGWVEGDRRRPVRQTRDREVGGSAAGKAAASSAAGLEGDVGPGRGTKGGDSDRTRRAGE